MPELQDVRWNPLADRWNAHALDGALPDFRLRTRFYWWSASGNLPPVVALHGFTGEGLDFAPGVLSATAPLFSGWIAPDLPGHGATVPTGSEEPIVARAFSLAAAGALARQARSLVSSSSRNPWLLGYSMGARIALHLYLEEPAHWSGLFLIGGTPGIEDESQQALRRIEDQALAERICERGVPAFLQEWRSRPLIRTQSATPEPFRSGLLARRLRADPVNWARAVEAFSPGRFRSLWGELERTAGPIFWLVGAGDARYREIALDSIRRCPPGAACLVEVAQAGHAPHLENPEGFGRALAKALSELRSGQGSTR